MEKKTAVLRDCFGHSTFRAGQEAIVDALLAGRDALGIMPTGAGKSVCYQVPAMLFSGITVVVSPLISLMKDQVGALCQSGVAAAFLNSSLSPGQYRRALQNMAEGKYTLVYVAPERLTTTEFLQVCTQVTISMVAVDEAHCVSQWGQDFRPSYLKIPEFINRLPHRPVVSAFTATATDDVKADILRILQLRDPLVVTTGFDRPNLFFSVTRPKSKPSYLLDWMKERKGRAGIVYCATRKAVEEVCTLLCENGYAATRYHAGLPEEERRRNQDDFVFDRRPVMVATNAFGMGIDKSNVAFVVHYNMPKNLESYYQEAGRAGRDGEEAECVLLYSPQDVRTNQFLIDHSDAADSDLSPEEREAVREQDCARLKQMTFYSTTSDCLRGFILRYFGDTAPGYCGKCSNCLTQFETADITVQAQKILSCVAKTGQRFGKKLVCDVLRGCRTDRIAALGLDRQSTFGLMKETSEKSLRAMLDFLTEQGYLAAVGADYPVLRLTPSGAPVLRGECTLAMKIAKETKKAPKQSATADTALLQALKDCRRTLAAAQKVPAYMVFSDATLLDMCRRCPRTEEEFLDVSGVGKSKLARYGEAFLQTINTALQTKASGDTDL